MGLFSRKSKLTPNGDSSLNTNGHSTSKSSPLGLKRSNTNNPTPATSMSDMQLPRAPDPNTDPAGYLRSIYAVRERSKLVLEKAKRNQLRHFDVDMSKFKDTAGYVVSIIKVSWANIANAVVQD